MQNEDLPYKPRSRIEVLAFMASLSSAAAFKKEAEGYMLELLAAVAFRDPSGAEVIL